VEGSKPFRTWLCQSNFFFDRSNFASIIFSTGRISVFGHSKTVLFEEPYSASCLMIAVSNTGDFFSRCREKWIMSGGGGSH